MKINTHTRKNALLAQYTPDQLRAVFAARLDDEAFAEIGRGEMDAGERREARKSAPHLFAWLGYEIVCGVDKF